jgi:hypothetical protein
MEDVANLFAGFAVVLQPANIALMVVGILLGVVIGVLPGLGGASPSYSVRPDGVCHQWRKDPSRELSIDLVADERLGRVTGHVEAS